MQSENRLFDDLVKMVNGAAGTLAGMGREAEASFKERGKEWLGGLDFVSRDEFEAVKAMAAAARDEAAGRGGPGRGGGGDGGPALRARSDVREAKTGPSPAAGASSDTASSPDIGGADAGAGPPFQY